MHIKAKKYLGQHFLKDKNIAGKIAGTLSGEGYTRVLEIGPGTGMLTRFLLDAGWNLKVVEIDSESVLYLKRHFPGLAGDIFETDFLKMDLAQVFPGEAFAVTGNFPYNISSQIVFKILENREIIPEFTGMFQREVARRITSRHGSKEYGIISVLSQLYYDTEYLFEVPPQVFSPPPKVHSAVIRLRRKSIRLTEVDEDLLKKIVKTAFGQRRKILKNSLKPIVNRTEGNIFARRPEQLSPEDFVYLTKMIGENMEKPK